jgi:hypothetical protein
MDNIEKALTSFLQSGDACKMSMLLVEAMKTGNISYEVAKAILDEDPEDILMLGYAWRLLLPIRAAKAGDWEDRMLILRPGERYQMPNVVRHLVSEAVMTSTWKPEKAVLEVFRSIGEPDVDKMQVLVKIMTSELKGCRISGVKIKEICKELALEDRIDPLISELKAVGIMSPKLTSLTEASRAGSPIYEFNPSLLVGEHL